MFPPPETHEPTTFSDPPDDVTVKYPDRFRSAFSTDKNVLEAVSPPIRYDAKLMAIFPLPVPVTSIVRPHTEPAHKLKATKNKYLFILNTPAKPEFNLIVNAKSYDKIIGIARRGSRKR